MPDAQSNDEVLQEIVAYLDGELSPEESVRVERRLATDDDYRQQLQSIERAWNALDELPLATVDDEFSRTTMTMAVKVAAQEVEAKTTALPTIVRRQRLSACLTAAAAAALGFLVVRLAWQDPNAALIADLPIVDNLDIYAQVRDAAFLRGLQDEMANHVEALSGASTDLSARLARFAAVAAPDNRDEWLRNLSPAERTNLRARYNRFRDLSPEEQDRLRKLHAEVAAPDADDLRRTLLLYQEWLRGLPPDRQFELRAMSSAQRVETIKRWAAEMRDDALFALSEEELQRLVQSIRQPLADIRREITRGQEPGRNRRGRDRLRNREDDRARGADADRDRDRGGDRGGDFFWQPLLQYRRELSEQLDPASAGPTRLYDAVLAGLPERTRPAFEALSRRERVERLLTWMRQYSASVGEVSQQDLERFFAEELDVKTRAELLSLPPGEMEQALRWRYRRQPNAGFPGRWRLGGPGGAGPWDGPWQEGPPRRGPMAPGGGFERRPRLGPGDERPLEGPPRRSRDFGGPGFDDRPPAGPLGEGPRPGPPQVRFGPGPEGPPSPPRD